MRAAAHWLMNTKRYAKVLRIKKSDTATVVIKLTVMSVNVLPVRLALENSGTEGSDETVRGKKSLTI